VIERYIEAGIEHIFLGYDHIAFLVAVVLWTRRLWPVVKVVTAFTIAHSITLSLAALDIVRIPNTIIEPAIAAPSFTWQPRTFSPTLSTSGGVTPSASG
jgi:hydrogenase/urease accessory protein HupE